MSLWVPATFGAVVAIGVLLAVIEIVTRYPGLATIAFRQPAAIAYLVLNAASSIIGLIILRSLDVPLLSGWMETPFDRFVVETLIAGFLAPAVLRASIFTVANIPVGPAFFTTLILDALDRSVDRAAATYRLSRIDSLMHDVPVEQAREQLPSIVSALAVDKAKVSEVEPLLAAISAMNISDSAKALQIGTVLANRFGVRALEVGVQSLGPAVKEASVARLPVFPAEIPPESTELFAEIIEKGRARLDELHDRFPANVENLLEKLRACGLIEKVPGAIEELSLFIPSVAGLAAARKLEARGTRPVPAVSQASGATS